MASASITPLQQWIGLYGNNYIAHALPLKNFPSILKDGALRCSEDLYRSSVEVEFEKGRHISFRGRAKMPLLEASELAQIDILDPEEQNELNALLIKKKQGEGLTDEERVEFKTLRKKLKKEGWKHLSLEEKEFLMENADRVKCPPSVAMRARCLIGGNIRSINDLQALREKYDALCEKRDALGLNSLTEGEKQLYKLFLGKETLTVREKDYIRFFERRQKGFECVPSYCEFPGYKPVEQRVRAASVMQAKYNVSYDEIIRAFDTQRGKIFTSYLTRKYEKYIERGMEPSKAIHKVIAIFYTLFSDKLQESIAFRRNFVDTRYGNIAVLRGKPEEVVGWVPIHVYTRDEVHTLSLFQNKGEFFRLPLNGEHTLVMGEEKELAAHLPRLTELKCTVVYTNTLTAEERAVFKLFNAHY